MKLSTLFQSLPVRSVSFNAPGFDDPDPDISSIHYSSREVSPGGLFVAINGFRADGHAFIGDAVSAGASAVLVQKPVSPMGIPVVEVEDTRKILADVANIFYGAPSERLTMIGITGTNGKTTTSLLIESILSIHGLKSGVIGTIDYHLGPQRLTAAGTTPESLDLQRILSWMADEGASHVVMEASSHAIDLHRLRNCHFDVAVFTNLTQDHLDYHQNMENYWACKKRLFCEHLPQGPKGGRAKAVVNTHDPYGAALSKILSVPCYTTGYSEGNMVWAKTFTYGPKGIQAVISTPEGDMTLSSPLTGAHNVENILCAVGAALAVGIPLESISKGIQALAVVPGRLEPVSTGDGPYIFVDYAHTPDALENVLKALRSMTGQRIICIFGCGGDRDRAKRPIMGEIAGRLSDLAVVTSDNPRTEPPLDIIQEIMTGVRKVMNREYREPELSSGFSEKGAVICPDRRQAIRLGIRTAVPGDIVLIAGKGHETYQIIGRESVAFDDRKEAKAALCIP